jgi:glucose-6-phosphate isomerase
MKKVYILIFSKVCFMIKIDTKYSLVNNVRSTIKLDLPLFAQYSPNFEEIDKLAKKYKNKKNIIVIGNGGSITSFHFFLTALKSNKNVFLVSTMEPDFLADVKSKCKKEDTVIIAISKSGTNVGPIESLMYFIDYPSVIIITEQKKSAIKEIQERYNFDFIEHPPVGGRYSGFTPSGLMPAAIAGLDIKKIWVGASKAYKLYDPKSKNNAAIQLASVLYDLDKKGYGEIFMPIYSSKLFGSGQILTQLIHESAGKERKGPTILAVFAPESQHHTNQRFFGGKRNMLGCFVVVDEQDQKYDIVKVPKKIKDIKLREGTLEDLNDNFYSKALYSEFYGTWKDAVNNKIPNIVLHVDKVTPESAGMYLAFWHYVTAYLCTLYDVNPFDQPQVESSKEISFLMRKKK